MIRPWPSPSRPPERPRTRPSSTPRPYWPRRSLEAENIVRKAQRAGGGVHRARALAVARQEALFRARLVEILDDYKALLERGRDEARQLTKAVAELADDAAAAARF